MPPAPTSRPPHQGFLAQGDTLSRGWCRLYEGRLAERRGDGEAARVGFQDAERAGRALGARRLQCEGTLALAALEASHDADLAAAHLRAAAELADALGVPDLVIGVQGHKGLQSLRLGQRQRAVAWWRRCAVALGEGVERLGHEDDAARFLAHPERRWILDALEELLRTEEDRQDAPEEVNA